jgi:hypothetical protein
MTIRKAEKKLAQSSKISSRIKEASLFGLFLDHSDDSKEQGQAREAKEKPKVSPHGCQQVADVIDL